MASPTLTKRSSSYQRGPGYRSKRLALFTGYAILIAGALFLVMPVFWALANSLKVDSEYMTYPVQLFPKVPQWRNYIDIWTKTEFAKVAWRTFVLGITTATMTTFVSALSGYAFAR